MDKLITIRQCDLASFWSQPNVNEILLEYARESSIEGMPDPNPNRDLYSALEACGAFSMLCAFRGDELIGFLTLVISLNPHYGQILAVTESYFVTDNARHTGAGLRLLQEAEFHARSRNAIGLMVSAPVGSRLERVLPGRGFRETNRAFFRGLA